MRMDLDPDADAIYINLRDLPHSFSEEIGDSRIVDYAADEQPIGIELLNVSFGVDVRDLPEQEAVTRLLQQHGINILMRSA